MQINDEIIELLKEFGINVEDGVLYLISTYYQYTKTTIFPDTLVKAVLATGILKLERTGLEWKVPLFKGQEAPEWAWVKESYIPLFKSANSNRGGNSRDCIARFKKLFAKYPSIRVEDVLNATKMYIEETDREFIRNSHYFILKGIGANKSSDLLEWVDRYKERDTSAPEGLNNTLQR